MIPLLLLLLQLNELPSAVYLRGIESLAPLACPSTRLTFYVATDTARLYWCAGALGWSLVGDVINQPTSATPAIRAVGTLVNGICQASGTGFHVSGGRIVSNEVQANCVLP